MNTLQRIAGVDEAQRSDAASPQPHAQPLTIGHTGITPASLQPPPIPPKDDRRPLTDKGDDDDDTRSQRRASLPLNRKPSHKSFKSSQSRRSSHRARSIRGDDGDIPPTPRLDSRSIEALSSFPGMPQPGGPQMKSQVSLPHSRLTGRGGEESAGEEESDFEWGPQHPCFPHPNPHCAPNSEEASTTRVIRVKRDWLMAGDLFPQYANLYPEILDPLVTDEEFRTLVSDINSILKKAFSPYSARAWLDNLLGVATGYIYDDLGLTGAKAGEKELERFIKTWNTERARETREVYLIQPRITGFMSLDFVVPDPGIDTPIDGDDEGEASADEDVEGSAESGVIDIGINNGIHPAE